MTQLKNFGKFCPKGLPSVANSANSESFLVQIPKFGFVAAAVEKTAAAMAAGAPHWFEKLKKLELLQLLQLLFGNICNVYGSKCEKPRKLQKRNWFCVGDVSRPHPSPPCYYGEGVIRSNWQIRRQLQSANLVHTV